MWLRTGLHTFRPPVDGAGEESPCADEAQAAAPRAKREEQMQCGDRDRASGLLGIAGFYLGNMKGVGRIYQQTFVDTYAKVAFAKLYTTQTPLTAVDLLNDYAVEIEESGRY